MYNIYTHVLLYIHNYVHYTIESYDGPKLEDDITAEFMKDLLKLLGNIKSFIKYCYYKVLDYLCTYILYT